MIMSLSERKMLRRINVCFSYDQSITIEYMVSLSEKNAACAVLPVQTQRQLLPPAFVALGLALALPLGVTSSRRWRPSLPFSQ